MKVLLAVASKHGATYELAEILNQQLAQDGFDSQLVQLPDVSSPLSEYDVVIIGSGVYAGRWLAAARKFAQKNAKELADMPVWLFSSGPVGEPLKPDDDTAVELGTLISAVQPIEHRVFAGKIDTDALNIVEKTVLRAVKAPTSGDYRDFEEVAVWGKSIARYLNRRDTDRHRR